MNILCIIDSLCSGGAQRQLVNLAKEFKNRGHNVSFLVYHKKDFYLKELKEFDIKVTHIIEPNYLKRLIKMRKFIRNGNYDGVISFLEAANFIATIAGFPFRKWKLVVGERSANPEILKSFKLKFYRWMHLFASYVVANSYTNLEMVRKINPFLPEKKCKVIYNLIKTEAPKLKISKINNGNHKSNLVIAASYSELKNLDGLIEAVRLLPKHLQNKLSINWYGQQDIDKSFIRGLKKIKDYQLESIFNLNNVTNNVPHKIMNAHGVGLFSHYEGFPNIICEGMTLKKPIICTNTSDLPRLFIDEVNAFLCIANDPKSIASALEKWLEMDKIKYDKMINANIELLKSHFNSNEIIDEYLQLLS